MPGSVNWWRRRQGGRGRRSRSIGKRRVPTWGAGSGVLVGPAAFYSFEQLKS